MNTFKALQISKDGEQQQTECVQLSREDLMPGDVLVAVEYSTINYKDGLAITGKGPVVRKWPMIPGIDFAGTVIESDHSEFSPGDAVVLNGWGVGEVHYGAYAEQARVKGDWLIKKPAGMTPKQCMAVGTAGYTAMLSVLALEKHGITPDQGPVLVTGANGGVGSVAVSILSKLGYEVIASTGRTEHADFLKQLGASSVIDRAELSEKGRPLGKERWRAAVDSIGSHTLANVIAQTQYGGAVTSCGLAQGADLPLTVMPFILRGVSLLGIDSVMAPKAAREEAWARLQQDLDLEKLELLSETVGFDQIVEKATDIVDGKIKGRVIVEIA
ncbi:acrylyl-CoA reductase (NADPH) [Aliamphritea spongicola]|uniref:acrylyl-CoA reductase (NADPH) n=1 Tax=Aliamphritea spongicola TaxID=707589 RepID=UPI00196B663C|nr:MDR family oxidoreductase [Aliamphritea spongicola]MBN3562536.1 oxidoreductase [Aliamphritea spongicola]